MPRWPVTFEPGGTVAWVEEGATVLDAAKAAGIVIPAPCGGRGVCGKCAVRVAAGQAAPPDAVERRGLSLAPPGFRLACLMRVVGPVSVRPLAAAAVAARTADSGPDSVSLLAGVDLGTTTCAAVIIDAASGRELGRAAVPNAQQSWGADVITRIQASLEGASSELKAAGTRSIIDSLMAACGAAGSCLDNVTAVTIAANPAMAALLVGADVSSLASAPFALPAGVEGDISRTVLDDAVGPDVRVRLAPALGGFVGGDAVAGLVAAGMLDAADESVYIDIGTNAELVVRGKRGAVFASAAAGPAFEGFGISNGGPAVPGAVISVRRADGIHVEVLGGEAPRWLAGSGLIETIAVLRESGHLDADGAMTTAGALAARFSTDADGVVRFGLGEDGDGPWVTQLDVRAFQTAKAAVVAALLTLSDEAGLRPRKLDRAVVAGTFGSSLSIDSLVALGVWPEDIAEASELFGDAALTGAAVLAFDPTAAESVDAFVARARGIELAVHEGFTRRFVAATRLEPYTLKRGVG